MVIRGQKDAAKLESKSKGSLDDIPDDVYQKLIRPAQQLTSAADAGEFQSLQVLFEHLLSGQTPSSKQFADARGGFLSLIKILRHFPVGVALGIMAGAPTTSTSSTAPVDRPAPQIVLYYSNELVDDNFITPPSEMMPLGQQILNAKNAGKLEALMDLIDLLLLQEKVPAHTFANATKSFKVVMDLIDQLSPGFVLGLKPISQGADQKIFSFIAMASYISEIANDPYHIPVYPPLHHV